MQLRSGAAAGSRADSGRGCWCTALTTYHIQPLLTAVKRSGQGIWLYPCITTARYWSPLPRCRTLVQVLRYHPLGTIQVAALYRGVEPEGIQYRGMR